MTCKQFRLNVEAFIFGELSSRASRKMQAHADTCPACAQMLRETRALVASVKNVGIEPMPASVEAAIRERLSKEPMPSQKRRLVFGKPGWALAVMFIVVILGTWAILLNRQQPVTAAAILAEAEAKLEGISSYHIKSRSTWVNPPDHKAWSCDERWYRKPSDTRLDITQSNSGPLRYIIKGDKSWHCSPRSGTAVLSPVSREQLAFQATGPILSRSPKQMLRELGGDSRYLGRQRVGKWDCEVIENRRGKAYIDRDTGFVVKSVVTLSVGTDVTTEATTLEVNKPVDESLFRPNLPAGTVVYKDPMPSPNTFMLNAKGELPKHLYAPTIPDIVRQGAEHNARLKELYTPRGVPAGLKYAGAGTFGENENGPDGSEATSFVRGFSKAYLTYANPRTGATLTILESADAIPGWEGSEVSLGGARGRIVSHSRPFPYVELFWKQGATNLAVYASLISQEQMIEVAKSMRLFLPGTVVPGAEEAESRNPGTSSTIIPIKPGISAKQISQAIETLRQRLQRSGLKDVSIRKLPGRKLQVQTQSGPSAFKWMENVWHAREGLPFR